MGRRPNPERLAEFQAYLRFFRAMWGFQEKLSPELRAATARPGGQSYGEAAAAWAEDEVSKGTAPFSEMLTGMKQAVADQLEMTRDLPGEVVDVADRLLAEAGACTLTDMRRRVWRVIPKILARGRIRTLDEFYVLKNVLDDGGADLPAAQRARLERLRFAFEMRTPATQPGTPSSARARRSQRRRRS